MYEMHIQYLNMFCLVESLLSELDNAVSNSRQQPSEPQATVQDVPPPNKASSATKELDDLMASLSDFKVNVQTVGPAQSMKHSDDYAKPQRATSSGKTSQQGISRVTFLFCGI